MYFVNNVNRKSKQNTVELQYNTRYVGLNWHAVKAKCILQFSHKQANTFTFRIK